MESKILSSLNQKQKEAVTVIDGPVLVIAGPGSGKTRCLTHRVAYLIQKGIPLDNILAVTFTNKAASEMKERIGRLISSSVFQFHRFNIGTFHATCLRILRRDIDKAILGDRISPYKRNFIIYDEADCLSLIKKIIKNQGLSTEQFKPTTVRSMISRAKDELTSAADYRQQADEYYTQKVAEIYDKYQLALEKANAVDFGDLIMLAVKLFQSRPDILKKYQERWRYIMVDEAHDTNASQYAFTNLLAQAHKNLWLIADTDQSIYSWRGADFRNILNFEKDYPGSRTILLEQNYRSTKNILEASNHVISKNSQRKEKNLWTDNPQGNPIYVIQTDTGEQEGWFVVQEIESLIGEGKYNLSDFTILYRTNAQSRSIEEAFLKSRMPYKIIGTVKFYERMEVKDILAYLKLISNIYDSVSMQRIINTPPRRLPRYTKNPELFFYSQENNKALEDFRQLMKDLKKYSQKVKLTSLIKKLIRDINYEEHLRKRAVTEDEADRRWENIQELCSVAGMYDSFGAAKGLEKFLEEITLLTSSDEIETDKHLVNLMTVHCAKGLEFPIVFVVGCEEGIFPHAKSLYLPDQMEEERRLCYVALTRAKHRVYLTCAKQRRFWGQTAANLPSRFIGDIPEHLINCEEYF